MVIWLATLWQSGSDCARLPDCPTRVFSLVFTRLGLSLVKEASGATGSGEQAIVGVINPLPEQPLPFREWPYCMAGPLLDRGAYPTGLAGLPHPPGPTDCFTRLAGLTALPDWPD